MEVEESYQLTISDKKEIIKALKVDDFINFILDFNENLIHLEKNNAKVDIHMIKEFWNGLIDSYDINLINLTE